MKTYIPFDMFSMRVDVPVSSLVRDRAFGWSCGQCPLGTDGKVLHPGNLVAQVEAVIRMIETLLRRVDFDVLSVGKLNVYFVDGNVEAVRTAFTMLAQRFPHGPVIVRIPVPHFYYDGMLVEIDVFAGSNVIPRTSKNDHMVDLQLVDGGELVWASARAELSEMEGLATALSNIVSALDDAGLGLSELVSDHWFVAGNPSDFAMSDSILTSCDAVSNPWALVQIESSGSGYVLGEFAFSRRKSSVSFQSDTSNDLTIVKRESNNLVWVSGAYVGSGKGLVDQTRLIMTKLRESLVSINKSFDDVVKLTAHYVGGATEEALHENMQVRHSFHSNPGPASTGLPVSAFHHPNTKIAIDVIATI